MNSDGRRRGTITIEHAQGQQDLHRFAIVDERGNVLETSAGFRESDGSAAIASFVQSLERHGWTVTRSPNVKAGDPWYRYSLTEFGTRVVDVPREVATPVTKLWIATLIVIVILFLICVVLALTAQIEIRPA